MLKLLNENLPIAEISLPHFTKYRTNYRNFAYGVCAPEARFR